jgi:hypothetical protein
MSHRRKSPSSSARSANGSEKKKRAEIEYLYEHLGNVTKENLKIKLETYNGGDLFAIQNHIINTPGLAQRLLKAGWITKKQKDDIDQVAKFQHKTAGGKRRYSTRSKKYKKSNKRSKRTRTLRRKRYSRKS